MKDVPEKKASLKQFREDSAREIGSLFNGAADLGNAVLRKVNLALNGTEISQDVHHIGDADVLKEFKDSFSPAEKISENEFVWTNKNSPGAGKK